MSTTVRVTTKRQVVLPKQYCEQKRIKPGATVRVTPVADGLYLTPIRPPTEQELREVFKAAGGRGPKHISAEEEKLIAESIRAVRVRRSASS
ncbi:MAG: AbrB/MazE/SpoVT family DNA-binding domain-containing protein [Verrucomicrobia bacterium]|nr:AbrB/MazE/SpoVT family DNA-binding domain-containing protein [Verrucomicrobiota bacterium]